MGGIRSRAVVLSLIFLLSSQFHLSINSLNNEEIPMYSNQDTITSTEVRIHNIGGEWDENQVLEWSPNHLEYNRTIQFSILLEGISTTENIDSMILNMTWIYNVSSGDPLLSQNLTVSDLMSHENGLFMYFNYTYPLDIFHDEYQITLDTIETDGTKHTFEHKGINVIAYDMYLKAISTDFDSKILFANNQVTSLELFIQNTGSVYTDIEFEFIFLTQLPSSWNTPNIFIQDNELSGGQNSVVLLEFQTPNNAFPAKDPMPKIEFQLIAEYEDFTEQMVEFFNVNYSIQSELVPFDSQANISAFRTNNQSDLFANNFLIRDPNVNILEYSLVSLENSSIEFFFEVQNYGFNPSTFQLSVSSLNSIVFDIYSSFGEERALNLSGEQANIRDLEPLSSVSFRCVISFVTNTEASKDPISIIINNVETGIIFELEIPIYTIEIGNVINPTLDLEDFVEFLNISILQNDTSSLYLASQWYPLFGLSYFTNNWKLDLTITNSNSVIETEIIYELVQNNSSLSIPHEYSIYEFQYFEIILRIGKEVEAGNYTINVNIVQLTVDESEIGMNFDNILQLIVIENSSLVEPGQNNSSNNSTTGETNNDSVSDPINNVTNNTNDSINNTSNQSENNSDNSTDSNNLTNVDNQETNDSVIQNDDSETDEPTKSQNSNNKSWLFIVLGLILIALVSIFIIRRNIDSKTEKIEDKTIVEINPNTPLPIPTEVENGGSLTVLHQWTDNNGYTWKQMSDRSMFWWNGKEWVPVNYN